jgi:hypothetical protein
MAGVNFDPKTYSKSNVRSMGNADNSVSFCKLSPDKQKDILASMNYSEKSDLLNAVRSKYQGTGKNELHAMVKISASMIGHMPGMPISRNMKELAGNTLKFMDENMTYSQTQMDIAKLNGEEVLARGICMDCTDASKLFMELFGAAAKDNPSLKGASATYIQSFDMNWAAKEDLGAPSQVSGHAIVQIENNGEKLYVDAAMFNSFGNEDPSDPIFKNVGQDGTFERNLEGQMVRFKIFATSNRDIPTSESQLRNMVTAAAKEYMENVSPR